MNSTPRRYAGKHRDARQVHRDQCLVHTTGCIREANLKPWTEKILATSSVECDAAIPGCGADHSLESSHRRLERVTRWLRPETRPRRISLLKCIARTRDGSTYLA